MNEVREGGGKNTKPSAAHVCRRRKPMKLEKIRKIRGIYLSLILGALALGSATVTQALHADGADGVTGCWRTISDKDGKITSKICIWEANGKLYGKVAALYTSDKPNPVCDKCQGGLKNKPIQGMTIMWGLKKGSDRWEGGKILDPEEGKTYTCKVWREGSKLKVRGYIAFFYRTQTWIR